MKGERQSINTISLSTTASFGAFTVVMFQVEVFWVVTTCSVMVGYKHFESLGYLHLQKKSILPLSSGEIHTASIFRRDPC
jgi:hypothetical protein